MDRFADNNYKVVQTIENGKKIVSAVPSTWENEGKLMWPPPEQMHNKSLNNFKHSAGTLADGWTEYPCKVKRYNIGTYSEAVKETKVMSNKSDTSESEVASNTTTSRNKRSAAARKTFNADSDRVNFNKFLQYQRLQTEGNSLKTSPRKPKVISIQTASLPVTTIYPSALNSSQTLLNTSHQSLLQEQPLEYVSDGQSYIYEAENVGSMAQNDIFEENPQTPDTEELSTRSMIFTLLDQVAKLTAAVEHVAKTQEEILEKLSAHSVFSSQAPCHIEPPFKRIDSIEECHEFEENLKAEEFTLDMIKKVDSVCGANCGLYGDNVAYSFADYIFSRRFFTLVTWTGISRGTEEKECFQKYERIFQFFFTSVNKIDSKYTIKMLKEFFQKLISNSKRRSIKPKKRISRIKHRSNLAKMPILSPSIQTFCDDDDEADQSYRSLETNNQNIDHADDQFDDDRVAVPLNEDNF